MSTLRWVHTNKEVQKIYDFFKHYSEVKTIAFEDRPIDIKTFGNIKTYKISVKNHIDYYNF